MKIVSKSVMAEHIAASPAGKILSANDAMYDWSNSVHHWDLFCVESEGRDFPRKMHYAKCKNTGAVRHVTFWCEFIGHKPDFNEGKND